MTDTPLRKIKPVDLYEVKCLRNADTFVAYDCAITDPNKRQILLKDLSEARLYALKPGTRILVYGYNEAEDMKSCSGHQVLITEKVLNLYDSLAGKDIV